MTDQEFAAIVDEAGRIPSEDEHQYIFRIASLAQKKERERCAKIAKHATVRPYSFKIHPDMEFDWFPDNSKVVAHACAQGIAMEIEREKL